MDQKLINKAITTVKGRIGIVDVYLTSYLWRIAKDGGKLRIIVTGSIYPELMPVSDLVEILSALECVSQVEVDEQACAQKAKADAISISEATLADLSRMHLLARKPIPNQAPLDGPDKRVGIKELLALYGNKPKNRKFPLIVVSGCFDVFHANHSRLISAARNISKEGRLLVITLSDSSVSQQSKNVASDRPIYPQDCRTRLLSALHDVDHVLVLDALDCLAALDALGPDLFVKNVRDKDRPIVMAEAQVVAARGGQTIYIKQAETGISTTHLVEGIRDSLEVTPPVV